MVLEILKKNVNNRFRFAVALCAVLVFAVRAVQMITQVSSKLAWPAATLYLLDYNFYFGSRTFIGSIFTLLTEHITYQQIFAVNIAVYAVTALIFLALNLMLMKKAVKEDNGFAFLLAVLFLVSPYSVAQYASWVGTYDIYLCLFALLCSMAAGTKHLHWVSPILCVAAIFTHYAFVFSFFPAVLVIQIYNICVSEKKAGKIISTLICFISSFVSAVYCGFFANSTIRMTREELYAYMEARLGTEIQNKPYIDSYYFNEDVYGMLGGFKDEIIHMGFIKHFQSYFLPLILVFVFIWCYYIIKGSRKQTVAGVFFILAAAVNIALIFLIIEAPRWQTAATLSQFMILFAMVKNNDTTATECLFKLDKPPFRLAMAILAVYNAVALYTLPAYFK